MRQHTLKVSLIKQQINDGLLIGSAFGHGGCQVTFDPKINRQANSKNSHKNFSKQEPVFRFEKWEMLEVHSEKTSDEVQGQKYGG